MIKKKLYSVICAVVLAIACIGSVACGGNNDNGKARSSMTEQNGLP